MCHCQTCGFNTLLYLQNYKYAAYSAVLWINWQSVGNQIVKVFALIICIYNVKLLTRVVWNNYLSSIVPCSYDIYVIFELVFISVKHDLSKALCGIDRKQYSIIRLEYHSFAKQFPKRALKTNHQVKRVGLWWDNECTNKNSVVRTLTSRLRRCFRR